MNFQLINLKEGVIAIIARNQKTDKGKVQRECRKRRLNIERV